MPAPDSDRHSPAVRASVIDKTSGVDNDTLTPPKK
jgi:hypothetical protein